MNYDNFSVHDLVCEALALQERAQLMGDREPFTDAMLAEIESALRKAVIREAQVGSVSIRLPAGNFPLVDALVITKGEHLYEWHVYNLIPKETP